MFSSRLWSAQTCWTQRTTCHSRNTGRTLEYSLQCRYTGTASVLSCCFMWFRVFFSNPGLITKDNLAFWMSADPPGDSIYPNKQCYTCELPRPARSRHCGLCKGCIAREDHHCALSNSQQQYICILVRRAYLMGISAVGAFALFDFGIEPVDCIEHMHTK